MRPIDLRHYEGELDSRKNDEYCGALIEKYREEMPVWVFLETSSFGRFNAFHRFCALRWNDKQMKGEHYCLRSVKNLRNACAHGACILNGVKGSSDNAPKNTQDVRKELARIGISKPLRKAKCSNRRMYRLATNLYLYCNLIPSNCICSKTENVLTTLKDRMKYSSVLYTGNDSGFETVKSTYSFLENLIGDIGKKVCLVANRRDINGRRTPLL